ncbi:hypothetical protein BOTCAL_0116g00130 [Botryotinia calthae]|uniref:Uncharacterized protein n=1 Tax=Botryotinia calthae TaxID=38488 RepID=A0A4Y8D5B9_9HELO|nr:hypothetical protein BOTCAL_0116g00130 [Botryotinia calthae]
MTEAEPGRRQQMRPEDGNELLRWSHQKLDDIYIFVNRYNKGMMAYITSGGDIYIRCIDREWKQVTSAIDELKLKQKEHPEELDGFVPQAVALLEESIGIKLSLEERIENYKRIFLREDLKRQDTQKKRLKGSKAWDCIQVNLEWDGIRTEAKETLNWRLKQTFNGRIKAWISGLDLLACYQRHFK